MGQDYAIAKYIYSNNISEVDKINNKKYDVPEDFVRFYEYKIEGAIIYTIYKKNLALKMIQ